MKNTKYERSYIGPCLQCKKPMRIKIIKPKWTCEGCDKMSRTER